MLGKLQAQQGSIRTGTKLEVAYFDQARHQLDEEKSIADNVADGKDHVLVNGQSRHVIGYLGDFLFSAARARTPVKALSGGERNRVLLAKLFLKPCNLLVMDEPTNDLDVETLELLEEKLMEFAGTLLLVSHDRAFLDNVVTQMWIFSPGGHIDEQVGGYTDWYQRVGHTLKQQSNKLVGLDTTQVDAVAASAVVKEADSSNDDVQQEVVPQPSSKKKLSYKLQRELDALPEQISKAETERDQLLAESSEADFYGRPQDEVQSVLQRLAQAEDSLEVLELRWCELEEMTE